MESVSFLRDLKKQSLLIRVSHLLADTIHLTSPLVTSGHEINSEDIFTYPRVT